MKIQVTINDQVQETQVLIQAPALTEEVQELMAWIQEKSQNPQLLPAYDQGEWLLLKKEEIYYFATKKKKVYAHTATGSYEVRKRLYELEDLDSSFLRISNAEIVNIQHIERFDLKYSGTIMILLTNEDVLYVSRRYMPKVREAFGLGGSL